ncbi:MAG: chromosome segregation protein SMC [Lachnospiraceae bacterium]|nr:chromosome segregation protein SMC [Lachnospiraceae bacterium]
MYLKSIEIQGFKSFANKIKLDFHNGFTGIVGPNGSGKSNVADAVRWVLGEQRVKQLRGGSMQDVIFAGTELRKPLSFAYVAITLDNSDQQLPVDYTEVTVARRLYRSGESEYLLNGVNVRLRDVQELFYDTGIGKEGYSIIGQGQIEKILSDKPEDRRELFDEAAGIVKFKRRKEQSLKKLENEQANLVRVTDILSELEKQVGPLEKQAEKARIYLKTREELKHLDVNVFLLENGKTTKELDTITNNLTLAGEEFEKIQQDFEKSRVEYEEIELAMRELEDEIEQTRSKVSNASIVRGKLEGDIKVFREQIKSAQSSAEHFQSRKQAVSGQLAERQKEKDDVLSGKRTIDDTMRELGEKQQLAQAQLADTQDNVDSVSDELEEKRNLLLEILNTRAAIRSRMAMLAARKEQMDVRKAELTSRLVRATSDEEEFEQRIAQLRDDFKRIAGEVADLNDRQKQIEQEIAGKKGELTHEDEMLRETQAEFHQEKAKLDALINLTERYEGFGNSVKRVMEQKASEPGLIGVVADLIKTEAKYETAIETALGGSIQNIVTKDEDTAKRMISLLKREKAGRATFLPLSGIENAQPFNMMGALKEPGIIGLADTLVKTAPEYTSVARSLLGRIVVADTFDHAAAAERKFGHKLRMVTLEGELFTPGGAISGGAFKNNSNLLGRRREVELLRKNVKDLRERVDEIEQSITDTKESRNRLRAELETNRLMLQQKFVEQNTARMNIAQEEEKQKESAQGYEELRAESNSIEESQAEVGLQEQDIQKELQESETLERETNAAIASLQTELTDLRAEEEKRSAEAAKWNVEIEKFRQRQQFEEMEVARIDQELNRLRAELDEIEESIHKGDAEIEEKQRQIEETEKTIASSFGVQEENERKLKEFSLKREEQTAKQKQYLEKRDALSEEKMRLDKEVFRLTSQKERLEESIDGQVKYMWEEYEITLSEAASFRDEALTNIEEMKKQIRSLKNRIRELGSVNVNAIEEYKELMERYTFMKTQHDDLVEAEKTLEKIIEDLDTNMRRQFKAQFARIQQEFDKVFKELFGGGSGQLELMEDQDILEAGVRVVAQPPGKKLQNMMQMSGGEKALTAISLLFAIQNLKPSPFCLLDEIEAALDESNVGRFAGYLHKLTKNTQFIVITHRRGTMDRADRLYGITMQEKGVSTLVSVSLIDEKDLTA